VFDRHLIRSLCCIVAPEGSKAEIQIVDLLIHALFTPAVLAWITSSTIRCDPTSEVARKTCMNLENLRIFNHLTSVMSFAFVTMNLVIWLPILLLAALAGGEHRRLVDVQGSRYRNHG
jgi:hypothetical protein